MPFPSLFSKETVNNNASKTLINREARALTKILFNTKKGFVTTNKKFSIKKHPERFFIKVATRADDTSDWIELDTDQMIQGGFGDVYHGKLRITISADDIIKTPVDKVLKVQNRYHIGIDQFKKLKDNE